MFLSFLIFNLFVECSTALALTTLSNASAGQTITVNWTRTSDDPDTFFLSLRKNDGSPLPGSQVDSNGATTGEVAITIPPDSAAGTYLFEGFKDSGTVSSSTPPIAGSNSFKLDAVDLALLQQSTSSSTTTSTSTTSSSTTTTSTSSTRTSSTSSSSTTTTSSFDSKTQTLSPPFFSSGSTSTTAAVTSSATQPYQSDTPLPISILSDPSFTELATSIASSPGRPSIYTTQIATSASSPKLPAGSVVVITLGSIAVFLLLLLCSLVLLRRYNRKRRSASSFYRDMMIRQRAQTPSFSTNHLPTLDFDAPPASQGERETDLEANTSINEKFPPPDYTSMQQRKTLHNAPAVIPPVPELPTLTPPPALAVPTVVTTPASPPLETASLGTTFPSPSTTVLPASTSSRPSAPGVRRPHNSKTSPKHGVTSVSAEILALKRKMLQLKQKSSEYSEVFSEAREGVEN